MNQAGGGNYAQDGQRRNPHSGAHKDHIVFFACEKNFRLLLGSEFSYRYSLSHEDQLLRKPRD